MSAFGVTSSRKGAGIQKIGTIEIERADARWRTHISTGRPGQWQWEALSDAQAKEIIKDTLALLDLDALRDAIWKAEQLRSEWKDAAWEILMSSVDDEEE